MEREELMQGMETEQIRELVVATTMLVAAQTPNALTINRTFLIMVLNHATIVLKIYLIQELAITNQLALGCANIITSDLGNNSRITARTMFLKLL